MWVWGVQMKQDWVCFGNYWIWVISTLNTFFYWLLYTGLKFFYFLKLYINCTHLSVHIAQWILDMCIHSCNHIPKSRYRSFSLIFEIFINSYRTGFQCGWWCECYSMAEFSSLDKWVDLWLGKVKYTYKKVMSWNVFLSLHAPLPPNPAIHVSL